MMVAAHRAGCHRGRCAHNFLPLEARRYGGLFFATGQAWRMLHREKHLITKPSVC